MSDAAAVAVELNLTELLAGLTGEPLHDELRRLALRAVPEAHYEEFPQDRPSADDAAAFLARVPAGRGDGRGSDAESWPE